MIKENNYQIIGENNDLNPNIESLFKDSENKNNNNYYIIGIIGGQSSGKSTLLNELFNTNFKVMDSKIGRGQTTKGIWLNYKKEENLMLLDIEGADSNERWEEKEMIEKSTALFGLVMSNLLIINIWIHDIGRFTSSNYDILKTILQINLQLFKKDTLKKIMFVIRDFNPGENFENIKQNIKNDVEKLWLDIKKPDDLKDIKIDQIIELDFAKISNFIYQKDKFIEDVKILKNRFYSKLDVNYIFNKISNKTNCILADLPILMKRVFDLIKDNKEINLPNQKVIISNYRCNEIKINCLKNLDNKISNNNDIFLSNPTQSAENIKIIIEETIALYTNETKFYSDEVVTKVKSELNEQISNKLDEVFKKINEIKLKQINEEFSNSIQNYSQESNILLILKKIKESKSKFMKNYESFLKPFCQGNVSKYNYYLNNFKTQIEMKVITTITNKLNYFLKKVQNNNYKKLETVTKTFFKRFDNDSYIKFQIDFKSIFKNYKDDIENLKTELSEMRSLIKEEFLQELIKELYLLVKKQIIMNLKNSHKHLIDIFKSKFEYDNNKIIRNWKSLEDSDIENLFKEIKATFTDSINLIKEFKIPGLENNNISIMEESETLLNEEEFENIKEKFNEGINNLLENVFNKKYNRNTFDRIPKWFWAIFIYAIHDNILSWISNPFILFILIIISGVFGYLSATGQMHLVTYAIRFIKSFILNKKNPMIDNSKKYN